MKAEDGRCTGYRSQRPRGKRERREERLREHTGHGQRGQGMVEYALILVLVSIVVIVILLTMGNQIQNVFSNVVAALGA
jgi:pilus assembly protein Flp/PilA